MRSFSILTFCGLIALVLLLSACGGDEPKHHRDAEAMGPPPPPEPVMHAEEPFFSGTLVVDATLSRGVRAGELLASGGHGARRGGGGHRRHHEESESASSDREGEGEEEYVYHMRESPYPPVSLRLHAVNKSGAPVEVSFLGCDSALGNFVVHPEKATVKSSEAVDTEPMNSRLGITGEDIPVTVELRVAGKTEKKVLILKPIAPAPAQPAK